MKKFIMLWAYLCDDEFAVFGCFCVQVGGVWSYWAEIFEGVCY